MSEPIPESIPTSLSKRSNRPTKKRALTPVSAQSADVEALFAQPDREIAIPSTSSALSKPANAPPEIVANVQGSSAGAGSGEFHVYKASRRREYERLRVMDEEVEEEEREREFREKKERLRREEEEKLGKNRAKRAKMKARKEKAELVKKVGGMEVDGSGENGGGGGGKRKLGAAKVVGKGDVEGAIGVMEGVEGAVEQEGEGVTFHDDD
ncbi:hypothetical protein LTR09_002504 [Extremus antarcticus]|uniref:DUF1168-domain-containing protein n=1 Tax=Extremus antarcticus TaxID=702011 RepID=A0AAJ0LVH8_9PEZI|nr:hypothetical protein LTR09_002504 [Extremus antarcticus]